MKKLLYFDRSEIDWNDPRQVSQLKIISRDDIVFAIGINKFPFNIKYGYGRGSNVNIFKYLLRYASVFYIDEFRTTILCSAWDNSNNYNNPNEWCKQSTIKAIGRFRQCSKVGCVNFNSPIDRDRDDHRVESSRNSTPFFKWSTPNRLFPLRLIESTCLLKIRV